jgi:LacI family transcriptional regulator
VEQGSRLIGYEAAPLLDRVMSGQKPRLRNRVVNPAGVVAPCSTDTLAIEDPRVAEAMLYISGHAFDQIQAIDVTNHVGVSRSGLDVHFKAAFKCARHGDFEAVLSTPAAGRPHLPAFHEQDGDIVLVELWVYQ